MLELASEGFTTLIFAGSSQTAALNRELACEIISYAGKAIWLASVPDPEIPTILFPETTGASACGSPSHGNAYACHGASKKRGGGNVPLRAQDRRSGITLIS